MFYTIDTIKSISHSLHSRSRRLVLATGFFDLLHIEHINFLKKAARAGDTLIVGVESDARAKAQKGEGRPIVSEDERIEMLGFLRMVDLVVIRDDVVRGEGSRGDLIDLIIPDILITSETTGDFTGEEKKRLVNEGLCGEVITLPAQAVISTTAMIRNLQIDGGRELMQKIQTVVDEYLGKGDRK